MRFTFKWAGASLVAISAVVCGCRSHVHRQPAISSHAQEISSHVGPQLLWDFTGPYPQQPAISKNLKDRIAEQIWPITHTSEKILITSAVEGAFYPGVAVGTQMAITAVQYSANRSQAEGPWSFLIIKTGDNLELYQNPYGTSALRSFRPKNAQADLLLLDAEGGEQGEDRHFARVVSVAHRSIQLVLTIGLTGISDCAGSASGDVADRIYYSSKGDGSILIQSRQHFYRACSVGAAFRPLPLNHLDPEQTLIAISERSLSQRSAPPTSAQRVQPPQGKSAPDLWGDASPVARRTMLANLVRSTWKNVQVENVGLTMTITHPGMDERGAQQILDDLGTLPREAGLQRIDFVRTGGICEVAYERPYCEYAGPVPGNLDTGGSGCAAYGYPYEHLPEVRQEPCPPHTWVYNVPRQ